MSLAVPHPPARTRVKIEPADSGGRMDWQIQSEDGDPVGVGLFVSQEAATRYARDYNWRVLPRDRTRSARPSSPA